jgi:uncharacterized membrane protein YiaA
MYTDIQNKPTNLIRDPRGKNRPSFFLIIGLIGVFAVLAGFSRTFIIPVAAGTFKAPFTIHLHAALAFSWVILFVIQSFLVRINKYRMHMTLGVVGVFIALGTAITMIPVGMFSVEKELRQGSGETAISTIIGVCTSAIIFISLVLAGVVNRKNTQAHKRLMLLATLELLWVAWFRFRHFFPSVPRPDFWFGVVLADSLIVIACIWDKLANGKVHPVLGYIGALLIAEDIFEVIMFDSPTWRGVAKMIYGLF